MHASYALWSEIDDGANLTVRRVSCRESNLFAGRPFGGGAVTTPVRFELEVGPDGHYAQYDPDFEGEFAPRPLEARLKASYEDFSLMSVELVEALQALGVDNLEVYDAEVTNLALGAPLAQRYAFVNVVGRPDCATWFDEAGDHPSETRRRILIHPERTGGLKLFRLAPFPSHIVSTAEVAALASDPRFRGLRTSPLESAPPATRP